jgi:hypothetical protein
MASIEIVREQGKLVAKGDLDFSYLEDPARTADGRTEHTLRAGWIWQHDQLTVCADRLGMLPIFYARSASRLIVGDSLREIVTLLGPMMLDDAAVAVFLRIGFYLGDDTPLAGVRVLSPGTRCCVTAESFVLRSQHEIPIHGEFVGDRATAAAQYSELFAAAVSARVSGQRHGLPLSGGRDSRHILLELVAQGHRPDFAVTAYDRTWLGDLNVAGSLSEAFGIPHFALLVDDIDSLALETRRNEATDYLTDEHAWYMRVPRELVAQGAELFFDGIAGDVLSNGLFFNPKLLADMRRGNYDAVARSLLGPQAELRYLSPRMQARLSWHVARDRLTEEVERHVEHLNPIKSFWFWNRTRREIALAPMVIGRAVPAATPYIAPAVMDFLFSLPPELVGEPGFHDEVISCYRGPAAGLNYSSKREDIGLTGPLDWSARMTYLRELGSLARTLEIAGGFVIARGARLLASGSLGTERWWISRSLYLQQLVAFARAPHASR